MTAADELRAAADLLDRLAAPATPNICPEWIYSVVRHVNRNCEIECYHPDGQGRPDPCLDHDGWKRHDDAPWIAAMGPQVAGPLAGWLRGHADYIAAVQCSADSAALAFARALLALRENTVLGMSMARRPHSEIRDYLLTGVIPAVST